MLRNWLVPGLALGILCAAGAAHAQNAVDIGGKFNVTGLASVVSSNPDSEENGVEFDDTTSVLVNLGAGYTTPGGRFEFGVGGLAGGFFSDADVAIYAGTGQARINTNALGPDENVILYVGGVIGYSYIDVSIDGAGPAGSDLDLDDSLLIGGPKGGMEIYLSPNTALQLEDQFTFDDEGGTTNTFLVGFKFLFGGDA